MPAQPKVVKVRGNLKNYPWGQQSGLIEFQAGADQQPHAELWFGNHASGPSIEAATNQPISSEPASPLLVKILAIAKPLSIQVHPDQSFATKNFEKLNLSDRNGKDEILIALETVWAFAGIKPDQDRMKIAIKLQLNSQQENFASQCKEIFGLSETALHAKINLLKTSLTSEIEKVVFEQLSAAYPNDPGVLVAGFLQFHELKPGEGLHVPPGCPHEYLQGRAIEVMTNSDNVFRMGLTNKLIDRENSLKVLGKNTIEKFSAGVEYKPSANFKVKFLEDCTYQLENTGYQVVLCLAGEARFESQASREVLNPGEALLISEEIIGKLIVKGRVTVAIHREDGRL